MAVRRTCIGCGYEYEYVKGEIFICPWCGTEQNPELKANDEDILMSAINLRRNRKFSEARAEYERILKDNPELGDAYYGMFLCDYEVAEEDEVLKDGFEQHFANSNRLAVADNENYQNAITYAGRSREGWEKVAEKIEKCRERNANVKKSIKQNAYRVAIVCDPACDADVKVAEQMYEAARSRVDVFYAPETLKNLPEGMRDNANTIALENVTLMFLVCSPKTQNSRYLKDCSKTFLDTHQAFGLYAVADDEDDIPAEEYSGTVLPYEEVDTELMLTQIRVMGGLTMEQKSCFREGGACVKNADNPSPVLL